MLCVGNDGSLLEVLIWYTVRDTENLPFSADTPRRFSEGSCAAIHGHPCGNAQIASVALRRSSTRQCADVPLIYTMWKKSWNERASMCTRLKTGIGCWSSILAVTLPLRGSLHWSAILSFVQVDVSRFRSFNAAYEGSELRVYVKALYRYVHTYPLGFVFRTNPHEFLPL